MVDHRKVDARRRPPHRTLPRRARAVAAEQHRFGLPIAVVDIESRRLLPQVDDLGVQRLARADAMAQMGQQQQMMMQQGMQGQYQGQNPGAMPYGTPAATPSY